MRLSLLIDGPPSSGLGGGSGFGVVYLGRYEKGRGSSILTCFGAAFWELSNPKAEVMSTATRPWLATSSAEEEEEEVSELSWMMRVFIVRGRGLTYAIVKWLKLVLKSWSVFMFAEAVVMMWSDVKWQMGRYRGAESLVYVSGGKFLDRPLARLCRVGKRDCGVVRCQGI